MYVYTTRFNLHLSHFLPLIQRRVPLRPGQRLPPGARVVVRPGREHRGQRRPRLALKVHRGQGSHEDPAAAAGPGKYTEKER